MDGKIKAAPKSRLGATQKETRIKSLTNIVPQRVNIDTPPNMGNTAIIYAGGLEWAVLPLHSIAHNGGCTCGRKDCPSVGKHPLIADGVKGATKDVDIVTRWWQKWPRANIGIATGSISGFFVLDVDGEEGEATLQQLEAQYGELPHTAEQITGSGGRHILFKQPEGQRITGTVRRWPGIDIRGDGNYIVVAPSLHKSGRRYTWEVEHDISETPLAEAPQWILAQPQPLQPAKTKTYWGTFFKDGATEGSRHNAMVRAAGYLLRLNVGQEATLHLLLAWNDVYIKPPLPQLEVVRIVESVAKTEAKRRAAIWQ